MNLNENTQIIAAWCGAGKTFICEKTDINAIEIEYWKYKDRGLELKYCDDVKNILVRFKLFSYQLIQRVWNYYVIMGLI